MDERFPDKTVIVTGASSGIGPGTARRFAAEGANLVVAARRKDKLDALVAEIGADRALAVRVAAAIAFLASADARFITGAVLPVDGGITASSGQPRF